MLTRAGAGKKAETTTTWSSCRARLPSRRRHESASKTESGVPRYRFDGEIGVGCQLGAKIVLGKEDKVHQPPTTKDHELEEIFFTRSKGVVLWYVDTKALVKFYLSSLTLCPQHEVIFAQIPTVYYKVLRMAGRYKLTRGSVLYRAGEPGHLWIVGFGEVSLSIKVDKGLSYIKPNASVRTSGVGAILGAETILSHPISPGKKYVCTATAVSPVALLYSLDPPALVEIRKICKDFGWTEFIDGCNKNLNELDGSIKSLLTCIENEKRDCMRSPPTTLRLTEEKREYFVMGKRTQFLYKKEEIGQA